MAVRESEVTLKRVLVLANLLVLALLAALITLQARTDRAQAVEMAYRDAENLADALAEHTRQTLAALDLGLTSAIAAMGPQPLRDSARLHGVLADRQATSAGTYAYFVLDAQGRLMASSRTPQPEPADLSDTSEFRVHRERRDAGLYLGTPRLGRVGFAQGQWIVNVSRRLETADGQFAGVAAAVVSLDDLRRFYDKLRLGEQGAVGLFSAEGVLIARSPWVERFLGQDFSGQAVYREQLARQDQGRLAGAYVTDGVERLSAFRRVDDSAATVYVGLGLDEVLAPWRERLVFQVAIGALAMSVLFGASLLALSHVVRREQWQRQRSQRLRDVAEASARLVHAPTVEVLLQHAGDAARRLFDASLARVSLAAGEGPGTQLCIVSGPEASPGQVADPEPHAPDHPARLAVPLVGQDGHRLGQIELTGHPNGKFSADDRNELMQLASVAGAALEYLLSSREREAALAQTQAAQSRIETILSSISDAVYALDPAWRFVYLNEEAQRLLQRSREDLLGRNVWEAFPEARDTVLHTEYQRARTHKVSVSFEFYYPPLETWFSVRAFPHEEGLTVYFQDITQRVETEARLRQAQKMDALGQLTGGVAHDFNNLLTAILGAADALDEELAAGPDTAGPHVAMIRQAGERAAALTHRLLAFARKQPLDPRQTQINELLADFEPLLRRTLGEHIDIEFVRGSGLWKALVDPNELQNAILNLAINARDAMPGGGRLTIETANMSVARDYAEIHGIQPGQYVLVAVSDTGPGMPPEVVARAFDPFFTTKPAGQGSGLGLSMVYGFARQSGGHVKIYSEPGHGTTVKLYLPRADAATEADYRRVERAPLAPGHEHVLLVEDDDLVRLVAVASLEKLGYRATVCNDGREAIEQLRHGPHFDLLLTDVVLAGGLSGKEVAAAAAQLRPGLKVLYMSGYTENAIVHHGRLDRGVHLLSKPFRIDELGRKLREVLDG
jgi:PAS domain S-box-containing protein